MKTYYEENDYLKALMDSSNIPEKTWLLEYFELYKTTLIWPPGFPPTRMCNMPEGTLRERFHSTYKRLLSEFEYEFDNQKRTLEFH